MENLHLKTHTSNIDGVYHMGIRMLTPKFTKEVNDCFRVYTISASVADVIRFKLRKKYKNVYPK